MSTSFENMPLVIDDGQSSGNVEEFINKLNPAARAYLLEQSLKSQRESLRKEIINKGKTELKDTDMSLYKKPRSGCNHCHGTGREGWDVASGEVIVCRCMRRGSLMDSTPDEFISATELMSIVTMPMPAYPREHVRPKSLRRSKNGRNVYAK